jgi:sterol desaturase/sphingolipid hydroxylase (fatty acid hydroxylase superfamily)
MDLDLLVFIAPLIGVLTFFMLEKLLLKSYKHGLARIRVMICLEFIELISKYSLSVWLLAPLAFFLAEYQIFSFSNWQVPTYVSFTLSILLLDFVSYMNHRLHHKIPLLWRLHRLHHTDKQVDSLTTFLHHPFELITSFVVIIFFAVIFDVPVIALLTYGLMTGIHGGFSHFNRLLPENVNDFLQFFLITPNFHRLHHSIDMKEGNSNFGSIFTIWDFLFGTSKLRNIKDYKEVKFGVAKAQGIAKISQCIFNPFIKG